VTVVFKTVQLFHSQARPTFLHAASELKAIISHTHIYFIESLCLDGSYMK